MPTGTTVANLGCDGDRHARHAISDRRTWLRPRAAEAAGSSRARRSWLSHCLPPCGASTCRAVRDLLHVPGLLAPSWMPNAAAELLTGVTVTLSAVKSTPPPYAAGGNGEGSAVASTQIDLPKNAVARFGDMRLGYSSPLQRAVSSRGGPSHRDFEISLP